MLVMVRIVARGRSVSATADRSVHDHSVACVVVAFDGIIAETLELRAQSIATAAQSLVSAAQILPVVAGRTLPECVQQLCADKVFSNLPDLDETALDIMGLHAQRLFSARVAQGIDLATNAREIIAWAQSRSVRLVLRADSHRRDVEGILRQWDLESVFTIVRCADDLPKAMNSPPESVLVNSSMYRPTNSSVISSYTAITARLDALGVPNHRTALELSLVAQDTARQFFGSIVSPINFDTL